MRVEREEWTPELYVELLSLFEDHIEETASTLGPLDVHLELYFLMEEQGTLHTIVARDDEGKVIGYMTCTISVHPHHQTVLLGTQDAFFVHKDHRNSSVGTKIIKKAEKVLIERGAQHLTMFYSESKDLKKYYERLGYKPIEHTVYKKVGD